MARHTKKWEQLYKSTMAWQRRAQSKERRLRKQGATNVKDISPVKSARDLQKMTYHELEKYRHELNVFTDRNTAYQILPSGQAVDKKEIRKLRRQIAKVNRMRRQVRERLSRAEVSGAQDIETRYRMRAQRDPLTGEIVPGPRGSGGPWDPVVMTELPQTAEALERRLETARQMLKHDWPHVVAGQRRSAVAMAEQTGNDDLVDAIRSLSDYQLSFAIERLGLIDSLALYYQSRHDYDMGRFAVAEIDPEGYQDMQQSVIDDLAKLQSLEG